MHPVNPTTVMPAGNGLPPNVSSVLPPSPVNSLTGSQNVVPSILNNVPTGETTPPSITPTLSAASSASNVTAPSSTTYDPNVFGQRPKNERKKNKVPALPGATPAPASVAAPNAPPPKGPRQPAAQKQPRPQNGVATPPQADAPREDRPQNRNIRTKAPTLKYPQRAPANLTEVSLADAMIVGAMGMHYTLSVYPDASGEIVLIPSDAKDVRIISQRRYQSISLTTSGLEVALSLLQSVHYALPLGGPNGQGV